MSFAKYALAGNSWELGKSVLALSTLGIFSKLQGLTILTVSAFPISVIVYSLPYALGIFTISFLWSDCIFVVSKIWAGS